MKLYFRPPLHRFGWPHCKDHTVVTPKPVVTRVAAMPAEKSGGRHHVVVTSTKRASPVRAKLTTPAKPHPARGATVIAASSANFAPHIPAVWEASAPLPIRPENWGLELGVSSG